MLCTPERDEWGVGGVVPGSLTPALSGGEGVTKEISKFLNPSLPGRVGRG